MTLSWLLIHRIISFIQKSTLDWIWLKLLIASPKHLLHCLWGWARVVFFFFFLPLHVLLLCSLWLSVPVLGVSTVFVWPAWQNPAERERKRASERGWETSEQCAERVFFFRTVCALFRPGGQLSDPDPQRNSWGSSTVFVCGCWGMDVFSLHLTVKHSFTYIYTFSLFCVSGRLWSSILSSPWHERLIVQVHINKMNSYSSPCSRCWWITFIWICVVSAAGYTTETCRCFEAVEICFHYEQDYLL